MKKSFINFSTLTILLLIFSSCSPWESDRESLYKSAQSGNKNAMFPIVMHYDIFEDMVPKDSFLKYEIKLIEAGNDEILSQAYIREINEFEKSHQHGTDANYQDVCQSIRFKWHKIGTENKIAQSYLFFENYYNDLYRETHNQSDSLMANAYYQMALDSWDMGVLSARDRKQGIIPLVKGGVKYGIHQFSINSDESIITRFFDSAMNISAYIMSGLIKLLISEKWWQVLLTIALILAIFAGLVVVLKKSTKHSLILSTSVNCGIVLGLWDCFLLFVAYSNHNPNWISNIFSLWFNESSYGLQPYLCLIPKLVVAYFILKRVISEIINYYEYGKSISSLLLSIIGSFGVFIISYVLSGFFGLFSFFIVVIVLLILLSLGVLKSSSGIIDTSDKHKQYRVYDAETGNYLNDGEFYDGKVHGHGGMTYGPSDAGIHIEEK